MNTISCPHCGQTFEISQALRHQIQTQELAKVIEEHKKDLEIVKEEAQKISSKKIQEQFGLQLKRMQEDAKEKDERIKALIEQITELTIELRSTKREKDEVKLEMQKKLALEEEKIRHEAQKKAEEEQHVKIAEKEKQLQDALKANEEMRRKLQQGSQQTQGEVFELEFEQMLRREFPNDKIEEVAKGIKGGDIIQEVWDQIGNNCGKILWELKNTKTWSEQWIDKLKNDKRHARAEFAVIISEVVPSSVSNCKFYNGVWVTKRDFVVVLASTLRMTLIKVAMERRANDGKNDKKDIVYTYLSSSEFRNRIEAIVDAFTNMQTEIEKERRYFTNKWARDEKNIRQVVDNTLGMHGDLKGIMGNILPQIKVLELLEDGESS